MVKSWLALITLAGWALSQPTPFTSITPGTAWPADDAIHIDAHGGNILYDMPTRTYYWYGEHYANPRGIACYTSTDFYNWSNKGVVFPRGTIPVLERPKVVYNAVSRKYVMWFHYDNSGYTLAHMGIAISDSLRGPFTLVNHFRPNGHQSRDLGMFADDDGKVYLIYSADSINVTIRMVELSPDFQNVTTNDVNLNTHCEGPGLMKYNGVYYLITSQCTGWAPNQAAYYTSANAMGPYTIRGDPCIGDTARTTFNSQSCFIFKVPGYTNGFIYMGDRWGGSGNANSRYVWLPIVIPAANTLQIRWLASWNFGVFTPLALDPGFAGKSIRRAPHRYPIPIFEHNGKRVYSDGSRVPPK